MESCGTAYRHGKTFKECADLAEVKNTILQEKISTDGKVSWEHILEEVDHDELVFKLALKYLRRDGYDIGRRETPMVQPS